MKIYVIFPKKYFSEDLLKRLGLDVVFIEEDKVDLESKEFLFQDEEYILVPDPTFLKDEWEAFPVERVKQMKGLKALCLTTTSYSWIELEELAKLGITVTNTPGKSTNAVAEFNIYMMMTLLRIIPLVAKNGWKMDYENYLNEEVHGKCAGIIGLGNIGNRTAELCSQLGMDVVFWNRSKKESEFTFMEPQALLQKVDVLFNTVATPPEMRNFLTHEMIDGMKNDALIVSTSEAIYDQDYVIKKVEDGTLGGFATESHSENFKNYKGNVMFFPEQAYYTRGTLENTARIVTETLKSILNGDPINKVN
jgi:D-3-phosphoglycerate dehydrogenase